MAENNQGTNSTLYFIVGGVVVAVAFIAYFYFGNMPAPQGANTGTDVNVEVTTPAPAEPAPAEPAPAEPAPAEPAPAGN